MKTNKKALEDLSFYIGHTSPHISEDLHKKTWQSFKQIEAEINKSEKWLPIEKAPLDGTIVLLAGDAYGSSGKYMRVGWNHGGGWQLPNGRLSSPPSHFRNIEPPEDAHDIDQNGEKLTYWGGKS